MRADLLRHRKDDGAIVTLEEVVKKAKAWEISTRINAQVMESKRTAEQVNFTKSEEERSGRRRQCGFCGGAEQHPRRLCPAAKPGVCCYKCGGRNHFASICRNAKDQTKMESPASRSRQKTGHRGPAKLDRRPHTAHMVGRQAEQESSDDEHNYTLDRI